jgi:hypothetical protein
MSPDQVGVEPLAEQRPEAPISGARLKSIESPIRQTRDARFEVEPEQVHYGEDNVGDAAAIDMQGRHIDAAVVTQDAVYGISRLGRHWLD